MGDIRIIGTKNCSRCEMVKNLLTSKKIEFNYQIIDDLNEDEKNEIMNLGELNNQRSFPFLISGEKLLTINEIIK